MIETTTCPEAEDVIDLTTLREVLTEVEGLVEELDGCELDETRAVESQSKSKTREVKARRSQSLQLLASRLELAAVLARNEYWFARGEIDHLNPERGTAPS